ncbi:MAG TPA: hypothetical protein VL403_05615 [Candidatus Kryptonia bacterium]|nr:hypothetical protein [Candidatus Kryptonia bacterium]
MPPVGSILVQKGRILEKLDYFFYRIRNDPDALDASLKQLRAGPLVELALQNHIIDPGSEDERHLREDWFRDWWDQPIEPRIRQGLKVVAEQVKRTGLNVSCYWEEDLADHAPVAVHVAVSEVVILTIHTPHHPPYGYPRDLVRDRSIVIITRGKRNKVITKFGRTQR